MQCQGGLYLFELSSQFSGISLLQYAPKRWFPVINVETYFIYFLLTQECILPTPTIPPMCEYSIRFIEACIQCNLSSSTSVKSLLPIKFFWYEIICNRRGNSLMFEQINFQGRHEFYRFMPNEKPPVKVFPVKGMMINVSWNQSPSLKWDQRDHSKLVGYDLRNYSTRVLKIAR